MDKPENLLTPSEVAKIFRVNPKTVTRWARTGRISSIRTLGGHRRFREAEIMALFNGSNELLTENELVTEDVSDILP